MRQGQDAVPVDLLIVAHITRDDVQAHVDLAEEGLDLGHLRHFARGRQKFVEGARICLVDCEAERDLHVIAKRRPVDHGELSTDHTLARHFVDPPGCGRRGDASKIGQRTRTQLGIGQQAALGKYLAFSRAQESSADAAGAQYLSDAGITGKGSLEFFGKLLNQEYRYSRSQSEEAGFNRTHPLSGDRIARLREVYEKDPAWNTPPDPQLQARFERVRAKLYGYLAEPARTLKAYPVTRTDIPARYARAYAYHKDARIDQALAETDALIASDPDNPYFLELRGQVLLESGRPADALPDLRQATELTRNEPLIASLFGHALIATENPDNFAEAEDVLRAAVAKDRLNPFAWYQLGVVYAAQGDMPRAHLASAEQQVMTRRYIEALRSAQLAESALPVGSADWLRAQDVRMEAQAALERERDKS